MCTSGLGLVLYQKVLQATNRVGLTDSLTVKIMYQIITVQFVTLCRAAEPSLRPTFDVIRRRLQQINPDKRSPVDLMMMMVQCSHCVFC